MSRPDCQEWAEDLMCIGSSSRVSGTEQCLQLHSSPKVQKLICNCIASQKCKVAKVAAMLQFSIIIIFMLLNQARTEKCLLIDWENLSVQIKFSDCVVHVCYDNCIATSIEQSAAISSFHKTQGSKVQLAIFMSKQPVSQWSPLLQQPTQHREPHCTFSHPAFIYSCFEGSVCQLFCALQNSLCLWGVGGGNQGHWLLNLQLKRLWKWKLQLLWHFPNFKEYFFQKPQLPKK